MIASRLRGCAVLLATVLLLSGCDRLFEKGRSDQTAAAEKKAAAGDFRAARQLYEASVDGTATTAGTHYRLALLCGDKLKDPLGAMYHLDRYLDFAPSGPHARDAKNLVKDYENRLLVQLSKGAPTTQNEALQLKNENRMLVEKIAVLNARKAVNPTPPAIKGEPQKKPVPPGSRTYTVKGGDTLAKISRQFYKTSARAQDIQDANFNQLGGTVKIKPGMELIIPK